MSDATDELLELREHVSDLEEVNQTNKAEQPYRKLDDRRRKTLLKIILVVAIEKYRFNPGKSKNSAPGRLEHATRITGLDVTDETIRVILEEALSEFPKVQELFEND